VTKVILAIFQETRIRKGEDIGCFEGFQRSFFISRVITGQLMVTKI
jgi:hypothetical protein